MPLFELSSKINLQVNTYSNLRMMKSNNKTQLYHINILKILKQFVMYLLEALNTYVQRAQQAFYSI